MSLSLQKDAVPKDLQDQNVIKLQIMHGRQASLSGSLLVVRLWPCVRTQFLRPDVPKSGKESRRESEQKQVPFSPHVPPLRHPKDPSLLPQRNNTDNPRRLPIALVHESRYAEPFQATPKTQERPGQQQAHQNSQSSRKTGKHSHWPGPHKYWPPATMESCLLLGAFGFGEVMEIVPSC